MIKCQLYIAGENREALVFALEKAKLNMEENPYSDEGDEGQVGVWNYIYKIEE